MSEQELSTLTNEERKRLDRQRFIGLQTQKRLLKFRVLLTPANGPNTQLAKNLILAGVNVTIYDDSIVDQDDFESNFLIAESDIGQKRGKAIFDKLKQMNPSGKNQYFDENITNHLEKYQESFFKQFTILVTSQKNFHFANKWDQISKKVNIPYYNLVCCGLYSFAYISLGNDYNFVEIDKKDKKPVVLGKIESLTLKQCLNETALTNSKQSAFLGAVIMMSRAQAEQLTYDPFSPQDVQNNQKLEKIVEIGTNLKEGGMKKHSELYVNFARTYGIDYCPVYSVLGSIVSQEIIKIAQNQFQPGINWLLYNSDEPSFASIFKLKAQQLHIRKQNLRNKEVQIAL